MSSPKKSARREEQEKVLKPVFPITPSTATMAEELEDEASKLSPPSSDASTGPEDDNQDKSDSETSNPDDVESEVPVEEDEGKIGGEVEESSQDAPSEASLTDLQAFLDFQKMRSNVAPPKPSYPTSPQAAHPPTPPSRLHVLKPVSKFKDVGLLQKIDCDLLDLFDESDNSDDDAGRTMKELVRYNKKRRRRLLRSVQRLNKKMDAAKTRRSKTDALTSKQDIYDQGKITKAPFNGIETMHMFREDLRTESLARRKWLKILTVKSSDGTKVQILDHYMRLSAVEMAEARRTRSSSLIAPAMNMYIAVWRSLSNSAKAKMLSHRHVIERDGPTLLWMLLQTYQGTAAQVIRTTMKRLDALQESLKFSSKYNIDKFVDYCLKTLSTLTDAGGDDSQAFDKIYEALKSTPNVEFNSVLVVWKSVQDQTDTALDVGELLCKAREEYRGMVAMKTW